MTIKLRYFLSDLERSPFGASADDPPWKLTAALKTVLEDLMARLPADYALSGGNAVHRSVLLAGSKIAHLSFVGDSILGRAVNCEAGSVIANYRNETVFASVPTR
jgi:hypothetical protein